MTNRPVTSSSEASEHSRGIRFVSLASALPLSRAASLLNVTEQAVAMASLYGRGDLFCTVNDSAWRFRWCCIAAPLSGVELRLRISGAEAAVLLEDLGQFGSAIGVIRTELPAALRTAYLIGMGAPVWRTLEALTGCTIEVLNVEPNCTMGLSPDCVGFEVENGPQGATVRGFIRPIYSDLADILLKVSRREMANVPSMAGLPVRWSAVVGNTILAVSEVRALEEQDIVTIDNAVYSAEGLACWLGVGARSRYAGRVMLRGGGQLQLLEFSSKGKGITMNLEEDTAAANHTGFDDIPVSLRFEVARWDAPLAEVSKLAAGSIIDLGQRIDEQSVTVWVEQRCIGKGQLIAIGERLGVRLLTVFAPST